MSALQSSGPPSRPPTPRGPRRARLLAALVALLAVGGPPGCERGEPDAAVPRRPNLVLVSLDTLRADALGAFGAGPDASPALDAFLSRSVLFERAYAHEPHTLPSHVTLFTSLHPASHGVRGRLAGGIALAADVPTLASVLRDAGYATAGFVNGGFLHERFGVARGFDHYDYASDIARDEAGGRHGRSAEATNRAVFQWLDETPSRPFFLFVHYFDIHSDVDVLPYDSPESYRRGRDPASPGGLLDWDPALGRGTDYLISLNQSKRRLAEEERSRLIALYHAGVRYTDAQFGALVAELARRGLLEETLFVVVSDHGEEFQEHGGMLHTQVYEESLHVPLAFRLPRGLPMEPGRRQPVVGLIDVMPTILDVLGIPPPPGTQGRSLQPWLASARFEGGGATAPTAPLVARASKRATLALRDERWKLIVDPKSRQTELYDLSSDPAEQRDLSQEDTRTRRSLLDRLRAWQSALPRRFDADQPRVVDMSPDVVEELRALGYGDVAPAPGE